MKRTDLEEETILEIRKVLSAEFSWWTCLGNN
jgi:hypothetical protein